MWSMWKSIAPAKDSENHDEFNEGVQQSESLIQI